MMGKHFGGNQVFEVRYFVAANQFVAHRKFMNTRFIPVAFYEVAEVFHQHPVNLQNLAEDGDASSQYKRATRYESGDSEKLDHEKALHWFRKAAENGNVMAMKSLAHIYAKGLDGVVADPKTAAFWAVQHLINTHP